MLTGWVWVVQEELEAKEMMRVEHMRALELETKKKQAIKVKNEQFKQDNAKQLELLADLKLRDMVRTPHGVNQRLREWSWWTHTGGGNALAFKQPQLNADARPLGTLRRRTRSIDSWPSRI